MRRIKGRKKGRWGTTDYTEHGVVAIIGNNQNPSPSNLNRIRENLRSVPLPVDAYRRSP